MSLIELLHLPAADAVRLSQRYHPQNGTFGRISFIPHHQDNRIRDSSAHSYLI